MIDQINGWGEWWVSFMGYQVLDSTMILLVMMGLWYLLRNRMQAQFGYCLFLLVLIKLLIPGHISVLDVFDSWIPGETLSSNISNGFFMPEMRMSEAFTIQQTEIEKQIQEVSLHADSQYFWSPFTPFAILMGIWGIIVFLLLIRFAWMQWRTFALLQRATPVHASRLPFPINPLQEIAGIKKPVPVLTASWVMTPVVCGVFRPVLLIPADLSNHLTKKQFQWILLHEFAHIRRHDNVVVILQKILQILFFFHPAVWITNWLIDQQREYACDDIAMKEANAPRKDCGEGFLEIAIRANSIPGFVTASVGLINPKTLIRRRLVRILDKRRILRTQLSFRGRMVLLIVALLVISYGGKSAVSRSMTWMEIQIADDERPPGRSGYGMVYDSARDVVVMHGGLSKGDDGRNMYSSRDTWEFDGQKWDLVSESGPSRWAHAMAYDEGRNRTILFAGYKADGGWYSVEYSDTWEWDGMNWKRVSEFSNEPGRYHGLAYDPVRQKVVRHGGGVLAQGAGNRSFDNGSKMFSDTYSATYEWDGLNWNFITDGGPNSGILFFDSSKGKICNWETLFLDGRWAEQIWELDGSVWKKIEYDTMKIEPPYRPAHAYDPVRNVFVAFGGLYNTNYGQSTSGRIHAIREWDGEQWNEADIAHTPESRYECEMVYDSKRNRMILFGGLAEGKGRTNDTWQFIAN